jgi:hypothetical protein
MRENTEEPHGDHAYLHESKSKPLKSNIHKLEGTSGKTICKFVLISLYTILISMLLLCRWLTEDACSKIVRLTNFMILHHAQTLGFRFLVQI